jgi:hypothetical protein
MDKPAGKDTTGVNLGARRLCVPGAVSKLLYRLSREETDPYIARTATTPGEAVAAEEIAGRNGANKRCLKEPCTRA